MGPVKESAVPEASKAGGRCGRQWTIGTKRRRMRQSPGLVQFGQARGTSSRCCSIIGRGTSAPLGTRRIFPANAHRTSQVVGWQRAEPSAAVAGLRLLATRRRNPSHRNAPADLPGRRNRESGKHLKTDWQAGRTARRPLSSWSPHCGVVPNRKPRTASWSSSSIAELIPSRFGDGLFAGANLLLRQPGIVALHAVTTGPTPCTTPGNTVGRLNPPLRAVGERRVPADVPPGNDEPWTTSRAGGIDQLSTVETPVSREGMDTNPECDQPGTISGNRTGARLPGIGWQGRRPHACSPGRALAQGQRCPQLQVQFRCLRGFQWHLRSLA